jgi:hypothetical protein
VAHWLESNGHGETGVTITAGRMCELAHAWWGDRLSPDWHPRSPAESQAILDRLGLTGEFWQLPG